MTDDQDAFPLPYARPKVGRRASDRKVLDEWYAEWRRREQHLLTLRRDETEQTSSSET